MKYFSALLLTAYFLLPSCRIYAQQPLAPVHQSAISMQGSISYRQELGASVPAIGTLVFAEQKSLYYCCRKDINKPTLDQREISDKKFIVDIDDREGQCVYIDRTKNQITTRQYELAVHTNLLVEDAIPTFNWDIKTTTKTLGKYQVQLATTSFHGRQYEAWFAPELPLPLGPWKFGGLPGLILEVYDTKRLFLFEATAIDLPATVLTPVIAPTQGQLVAGWKAYCALTKTAEARMIKFAQSRPGVTMSISRAGSLEVVE